MAQIVARASNTVRNKNVAMLVMCFVFLCWFAYDGFINWPARDDTLVTYMKGMVKDGRLDERYLADLEKWKGWNNETAEGREHMNDIATMATRVGRVENWKGPLDLTMQRWIVVGLGLAVLGAIGWLVHCQRRRVIGEEETVSPAPGVVIPWGKIKVVDNSRWKKSGIVDITYVDEGGQEQTAKFDDYVVEREPLIQILDMMGEKAAGAEFLPKEEAGGEGMTNDK